LARGWAISGIGDQVREAAMAAADAAGMEVGAWVEQALRQALEARAEPAQPEGVEIEELEAMVRRYPVRKAGQSMVCADARAFPWHVGVVRWSAWRHRFPTWTLDRSMS
jgi:hypothetical protein